MQFADLVFINKLLSVMNSGDVKYKSHQGKCDDFCNFDGEVLICNKNKLDPVYIVPVQNRTIGTITHNKVQYCVNDAGNNNLIAKLSNNWCQKAGKVDTQNPEPTEDTLVKTVLQQLDTPGMPNVDFGHLYIDDNDPRFVLKLDCYVKDNNNILYIVSIHSNAKNVYLSIDIQRIRNIYSADAQRLIKKLVHEAVKRSNMNSGIRKIYSEDRKRKQEQDMRDLITTYKQIMR
ncbi:MAG: hypothetical protein ACLRFM_02740 [Alphaproteobacteria bacterium]